MSGAKTADDLLNTMAKHNGIIVGTNRLDQLQIAISRCDDAMYVNEDGLGFVVLNEAMALKFIFPNMKQQLSGAQDCFERNKEQSLKIVKLLSALEAAGLMSGKTLPDYLYDDIHEVTTELSKEILK